MRQSAGAGSGGIAQSRRFARSALTLIFLVILIFSPCALVPNSTTVLIPFASTLLCDTTGTTGATALLEELLARSAPEGDTGPSSSPSTSPQFILLGAAALLLDEEEAPHLTARGAAMAELSGGVRKRGKGQWRRRRGRRRGERRGELHTRTGHTQHNSTAASSSSTAAEQAATRLCASAESHSTAYRHCAAVPTNANAVYNYNTADAGSLCLYLYRMVLNMHEGFEAG